MTGLIIKHFPKEQYSTLFNPQTGFFARIEEPGCAEPFWSSHGPELIDIAVTSWCDRGCPVCYRSSTSLGKHMLVEEYETIMRQAQPMHVFQVALGGGNPNQHPDFCEILRLTRERYGIVPNYTTNGRGLSPDVLQASKQYCGAVAVSAYTPYDETREAAEVLIGYGIKTNIHFVLGSESIHTAIAWLEAPPPFLEEVNAIVFLNYKPVGRHPADGLLLADSDRIETFFRLATGRKYKFRIGFDSCLVSGLTRFTNVPTVCYDACEAARFSMFVSEDMRMYPCSFMASLYEGIPIEEANMLAVWQSGALFTEFRDRLLRKDCSGCLHIDVCRGGCPVFPEVNLCPRDTFVE